MEGIGCLREKGCLSRRRRGDGVDLGDGDGDVGGDSARRWVEPHDEVPQHQAHHQGLLAGFS